MLRVVCALAFASFGCGDDDAACAGDEDCGAFQRCIERACRPLPRTDASVRDGGTRDGGARDGGSRDAGRDAGAPIMCALPEACPSGYTCVEGLCRCGEPGTACCAEGTACRDGVSCNAVSSTCEVCGQAGQVCCAGTACAATDLVCDSFGICNPCGGEEQPCCEGAVCGAAAICVSGYCRSSCGGMGQPCCGLMRCAMGLMCTGGACM